MYFLTTKNSGWDEVKKYDGFYEDIEVVGKKKFFNSIEDNYFLKNMEDKNIKKAVDYDKKDFLGEISLISRKENLHDNFIENIKNLKDIDNLKLELEKELLELKAKSIEVKKISTLIESNPNKDTLFNRYMDSEILEIDKKLRVIKNKNLHKLYEIKANIDKLKMELKKSFRDESFLQNLAKVKEQIT